MFIGPGVDVYKGQIVGIHQRPGDLSLNVCKKKAATNIRSNKEQTGKITMEINIKRSHHLYGIVTNYKLDHNIVLEVINLLI